MPKKTLQEETSDVLAEKTIEVNKFGQAQRKRVLDEISALLFSIKQQLLQGPDEVSLGDLRNMIRTANRMFKEGFKIIRGTYEEEVFDLLQMALEEETVLLQGLLDDYEVDYTVREPSYVLAQRRLKDTPIEDQTYETWFNIWSTKTNGRMKSGLFTEYGLENDRETIVNNVFGRGSNPLKAQTFLRSSADMNGLLITIIGSTNSVSAYSVAQSNTSIIEGSQWNSCLCPTTCPSCASLHSSIRYINGPDETDGNEIPLHPICMCFWTYLYKNPKHMNAKVPLNARSAINSKKGLKKFPLWYNGLSTKRKIELFGKTKHRMLESGEITINQILSRKNRRVYTLEELKLKGYNVAEK